jgi:hypothetical protein
VANLTAAAAPEAEIQNFEKALRELVKDERVRSLVNDYNKQETN